MSAAETPREIFEELLDSYAEQHDHDDYPIGEQSWWPAASTEWLAQFDAAEAAREPDAPDDTARPGFSLHLWRDQIETTQPGDRCRRYDLGACHALLMVPLRLPGWATLKAVLVYYRALDWWRGRRSR